MNDPIRRVTAALERVTGAPITISRRTGLGGGSISRVERLDTGAGPFVLKWLPRAAADLFDAEAAGLLALAESGTSLTIPAIITSSSDDPGGEHRASAAPFIVLEFLPPAARCADFDERLGRGLAELHRHSNDRFGFARDTYCGATRQPNAWADRWVGFYAASRLAHQTELAARAGAIDDHDRRTLEHVCSRLASWLTEPPEGPALIHGDLWSGNLHVTSVGRPALIDPAVYFAHREAELGMMTLFGGFSSRVFDAYHEAFPLEPGWRERNGLYQLYHVLNHVNLFGAGYLVQMRNLARRYA